MTILTIGARLVKGRRFVLHLSQTSSIAFMPKIHPYALIFVVVYFAFILFSNVHLHDDISHGLTDWTMYTLPAVALFIGYPWKEDNPSSDTVGNTIFVYVAWFLLIIPLSCSSLKQQRQQHEHEQARYDNMTEEEKIALIMEISQGKKPSP